MKRIKWVLALIFGVISGGASAEWTYVNGDGEGTQYIDLERSKRSGDLVKIWTAVDYRHPRHMLGKTFRSVIIQEEYDCESELRRTIFVVLNSGAMATGEAVLTDPAVTNWQPIR